MSVAPTPRKPRRVWIVSLALAGSLFLAGCSGDGGENGNSDPDATWGMGDHQALQSIDFTVDDNTPHVTVEDEIDTDEISARLIEPGDGDPIEVGDIALVNTAIADPETGEILDDNFDLGAEAVIINSSLEATNDVLYQMLIGNKVGSHVAFYIPADPDYGVETRLMLFQITGTSPQQAIGEKVDPDTLDARLPEVTRDEQTGEPSIASPEGEAPEELIAEPLIEGEGDEVQAGDYLTVQYRGIKWSDGTEFDSSWERGEPAAFSLSNLVPGWQQGLEGQRVGSQVLIVVPPELGYGEAPEEGSEDTAHDLAGETLVFVVDILHTVHPPSQ